MICSLNVAVGNRQGRSYLKDAYVTQPFRIVPVGQHREDHASYLMIMSSSPGILSGDEHRIMVHVEENSKLQLQSQSYQRLYNMEAQASQSIRVFMEKNSAFSFVSHPVVPHENSTFYSNNEFYLSDNCSFMFGEIITCGRKHSGEAFKYAHFQNMTRVYHNGKLILKDNVLLKPALMPLHSMGLLEGYTHQGTFVFINTGNLPIKEITGHLQEQLENQEGVEAGISLLQAGGLVIRVLGNGGEQLYNFFQRVQAYIWDSKILLN